MTSRSTSRPSTPDYESPARHRSHCPEAEQWSQVPYVINGVLIHVDDVDAHHEHAREQGATILAPSEDGPGRLYRAEGLEGQRWMFLQRAKS